MHVPVVSVVRPAPDLEAVISQGLKECKILVVEDYYLLALDVREILEQEGARVIGPASNAGQAFKLIQEESPDAAVLDVNLGQADAYPIARQLQASNIPFVFVTGYTDKHVPPDLGEQLCLEKPVRPEKLIRSLRQVIGERMIS